MSRAQRFNKGKPKIHLVPTEVLFMLARVYEAGIAKGYGENDWRKGMPWSEVYDSQQRHSMKFWSHKFSDLDEESGLPHTWHALWNALTLAIYEQDNQEFDDRYKESKSDQSK